MKKDDLHQKGVWIGNALLKKVWRMMKLTGLFMLVSFIAISAGTYSQNTRFSFKIENGTLNELFLYIERNSEFRFSYNKSDLDDTQRISFNFENESVDQILNKVLDTEKLSVSVKNDYIIITNKGNIEGNVFNTNINQPVQKVTGKVTDSSGQPLPGVTVVVKGTTQGTITDTNGNYSVSNISSDATLVFSFVGMRTQEVSIAGKTIINIALDEELIGIDEVVAVGYGTLNRQAVTGAVAVADLDKYREVPVNNILETVKGTVAGLNVGATNTAGAVADLLIRGQNSTGASNSPLIVVDGVIFNGSVGDIPSTDVENFTVLKDASAAAVYGARSANGVILIETKNGGGISGKPKFDVTLSYGISDELKPLEVYDADGYLQRILDIRKSIGQEADPNKIADYLQAIERTNYEATPNHTPTQPDPYSIIGQIGHKLNSTISVSNSTEKSSYYISASIIDQKGVVLLDEYKQFSGRVNIDSDITDWFNLGIKSMYSIRDFSGATLDPSFGTHLSPYASLYNEDGSYRKFPQDFDSFTNLFLSIPNEDLEKYNNLNATVSGRIKVPRVKGLSYTVNFSNALRWSYRNEFYDENTITGNAKKGVGSRVHNNSGNMLLDQIVNYKHTFAEKHNIDVTLLYSYEKNTWENLSASAEGFDNSVLLDYALENGQTPSVNTGGGESAALGQMARGTYTFDSKYSLTGTVRRDGFSAFSKNKKWGVFSSAGVNWNVTKESFMQNVDFIDRLAVRASYGSNGNQSIQPYSTLAKVGTSKYYFAGDPSYTISQSISSLALDNLGWEKTTGLNMGIDFGVFSNRIAGSVDAYKSKTEDLLFSLGLPSASGAGSILSNLGEIQNKGIEIQLHTENIVKNDFQWSSDFAFSLNRNKVVTIYGEDNDGDGVEDDLISSGYFIGRSLGTIYNYKVIGMWQQEDVDNGTIMEGLRPGDYKIEDLPDENGELDGKITSDNDRQFLGTSKPNFTWSWTNSFTYKDFSLMAYVYSIWGGNGYYQSAISPWSEAYVENGEMNRPVYDYWTPENTDAMFPRPYYRINAAYKADKYYDRSFIKLQKIALTYNLSRFVKAKGINNLRLTASADNLFTYAPHWVGLDPETGQSLSRLSRPSIRTYLFSLAFNF
jgi:TonB-linked SusC/RagA family outer membrane protein